MFERNFTVAIGNGGGPYAQDVKLRLPAEGDFWLEGWIGNFGSSNAYIFEGVLSLAECQARMEQSTGGGSVDCLLALTGSGVVRRLLPPGVSDLTVFFEVINTAGQSESVSIRVHT